MSEIAISSTAWNRTMADVRAAYESISTQPDHCVSDTGNIVVEVRLESRTKGMAFKGTGPNLDIAAMQCYTKLRDFLLSCDKDAKRFRKIYEDYKVGKYAFHNAGK